LHEKESLYLSKVSIVTSTTSNLFIYDKVIDKLIIIPHANIAMLLPKRKLNTSKGESGKEKSSS